MGRKLSAVFRENVTLLLLRHQRLRRLTPIFIQRQWVNIEAKCNVLSKTEIMTLLNCQMEDFVIKCKLAKRYH